MAKLKPTDIAPFVLEVLGKAPRKHGELSFLTAYQILDRLPKTVRARLIRERKLGGRGTGNRYAAASAVAKAAEAMKTSVEVHYLDTKTIELTVNKQAVKPTSRACGIFRKKEE